VSLPDEPQLFDEPSRPGAIINRRITLVRSEEGCAVMCGGLVLHAWAPDDRPGERVAMFSIVSSGLATRRDVARAFSVHENTVQRLVRGGLSAVLPGRPGPKRKSKLTPEVLERIAEGRRRGLNGPAIQRWLRAEYGIVISPSSVFAAVQQMSRAEVEQSTLVSDEVVAPEPEASADAESKPVESELPQMDPVAWEAAVHDAPVVLPEADHGRYMGLTLYYPALAAIGLVSAARETLRLRWSERFGVRAVVLTLFFLSLLRKTTLESAKHLRRLEFGAVVGSGRAPCVKTLRRKLSELGDLGAAVAFGRQLARRWVESAVVSTAVLYVDGHAKVYSGKRRLAEIWNPQRRMPLPGVIEYFVGDQRGRPMLTVSDAVSPSLARSLPRVVRAVREVTGDRPLTLVFDRGGYDGKLFTWLGQEHIDFVTYQRGGVTLPADRFQRRETRFEGCRVRFLLAEDSVTVAGSGPWRRIVMRTPDGHQTPILTSLPEKVGAVRVACLMFARWRQENFFRYMRQHHGLDTLVSNAWRDDSEQSIANPERKRLSREIAVLRAGAQRLRMELGTSVLENGAALARRGEVLRQLADIDTEIASLVLRRRIAPQFVTVAVAGGVREVMNLERKHLVDQIKIAAYNAEEWLLERLERHYRNPDDIRDLLRAFAELPGSIRTTHDCVMVTLHPPDTPAHRAALRGLCDELNAAPRPVPRHRATRPLRRQPPPIRAGCMRPHVQSPEFAFDTQSPGASRKGA
jgi:transposase